MSQNSTSVILTHGAWADGSSWSKVILPLQQHGLRVIAAPIPLTSLSADVAALGNVIERTNGQVILAARAYAGAVISAVNNDRVKSLVYIAALTPDHGETVGDVFYRGTPHPKAPHLAPDANGLIWMPDDSFGDAFAQNASTDMIAILTATQRPIALRCTNYAPYPPAEIGSNLADFHRREGDADDLREKDGKLRLVYIGWDDVKVVQPHGCGQARRGWKGWNPTPWQGER